MELKASDGGSSGMKFLSKLLLNIPLKKEKENVKQKKNRGRKCV
jgi:hypothetical protein